MKSKRLFQIFVLFVLVFSSFGSGQHVGASPNSPRPLSDALVINRSLNIWDATYVGFVSASIYEKWHLDLTEAHDFNVSVSAITGDLVPLIILQDANGIEIARGTGSLTTSQPAGSYYIQTQPASGSGFYVLTLRQIVNVVPSVSTNVNPASLNVGESAVVTVTLNNVPADGYTSAEFTCTYDPALLEASNIVVADLFGADAAVAINGPQSGSFIVAIAGSNGNKAVTSGTVFTFSIKGLQAGQAAVECKARVSKGDSLLADLPSTGASVTVIGVEPTFTPIASPTPIFTSTPDGSVTATSTPDGSATATSTPDGSATATSTPDGSATTTSTPAPLESPTPTFTFTPDVSPTPTFTFTPIASPTPLPVGSLTGQVLASKPVTVYLYYADNTLAASVDANPDGTFSLQAPAGTYIVVATASGFLSAQGSVTIAGGSASPMPTISLLAGDIDNNNVIDQFDAMTIGMSYNSATPVEADLNSDGVINVLDLELLARNYRATGPTIWQ
ncbi:MAG: cohesin domain-containing protein [Chloroflexota bacterium]